MRLRGYIVINFNHEENFMDYSIYVLDCETTGLDPVKYDVIEVSILRLVDGEQKSWFIQPTNPAQFEVAALRINGHKIEDLRYETQEGRETYQDPTKVIIDIENWLMEDGLPTQQRVFTGQNVYFDLNMLKHLWQKCDSADSFPFGRRYMDTMVIEMFLDYCNDEMDKGYSLANIIKKYGVKNEKAHNAAADVRATKDVFVAQVKRVKKLFDAMRDTDHSDTE